MSRKTHSSEENNLCGFFTLRSWSVLAFLEYKWNGVKIFYIDVLIHKVIFFNQDEYYIDCTILPSNFLKFESTDPYNRMKNNSYDECEGGLYFSRLSVSIPRVNLYGTELQTLSQQ